MQVYLLKGKGSFTDNEGKEVIYPISKLVLANSQGDSLEIKMDKTTKRLLPYIFKIVPSNELTEDEAGNQVEIHYLKEKFAENKSIMVE